jgi:hypothetical protein
MTPIWTEEETSPDGPRPKHRLVEALFTRGLDDVAGDEA